MKCVAIIVAALACAVYAAVPADEVTALPGFNKTSFRVYSGYLDVPGPINGYDSLHIHYQFHEAQTNASGAPVVTWHQGGPGGSSLFGLYGELGYFRLDSQGEHVNEFSWNKVANLLYLESPAGSNDPIGFSYCTKGGKIADVCEWDDKTQAEAYTKSLLEFFKVFPEYAKNDLYMTGESYAGQYVPNIAAYVLDNAPSINLKGLALGNACWGGDANNVRCNGPNSAQNDLDMFFGKGLVSKPLYEEAYQHCKFPNIGVECADILTRAHEEVGPHNVYNIYDNCLSSSQVLSKLGKSQFWLRQTLRAKLNGQENNDTVLLDEASPEGGYDWSCGVMAAMSAYMKRPDVQKALHLGAVEPSRFGYRTSGPASITLYPTLIKKLRVLIYNGDADSCVPYKGNEEWTEGLASQGLLKANKKWHPWFVEGSNIPAGYSTTYTSTTGLDFSFVTIRLAGHMVPQYQPAPALSFITRFLAGTPI